MNRRGRRAPRDAGLLVVMEAGSSAGHASYVPPPAHKPDKPKRQCAAYCAQHPDTLQRHCARTCGACREDGPAEERWRKISFGVKNKVKSKESVKISYFVFKIFPVSNTL